MLKFYFERICESVVDNFRHMSNESLNDLINNDEMIDQLVSNECKGLETEKDLVIAQNKSIAEYNLSLSPKLENGKTRLKELCDSVQAIRESIEEKQSKLKNHSGNLSSDTVLALLQAAAAESEEESEKIAEKFYQKEIEMEDFLNQFQAFRKLMHLRRVKADKMNDILHKRQNASVTSPSHPLAPSGPHSTGGLPYPTASVPYPTTSVPYPTASVPYPVGGMNMPYFPMAK